MITVPGSDVVRHFIPPPQPAAAAAAVAGVHRQSTTGGTRRQVAKTYPMMIAEIRLYKNSQWQVKNDCSSGRQWFCYNTQPLVNSNTDNNNNREGVQSRIEINSQTDRIPSSALLRMRPIGQSSSFPIRYVLKSGCLQRNRSTSALNADQQGHGQISTVSFSPQQTGGPLKLLPVQQNNDAPNWKPSSTPKVKEQSQNRLVQNCLQPKTIHAYRNVQTRYKVLLSAAPYQQETKSVGKTKKDENYNGGDGDEKEQQPEALTTKSAPQSERTQRSVIQIKL